MKKKLTFLKYFESFTESQLKELTSSNKTYLKRRIREDIEYSDEYKKVLKDLRNYDVNNFNYKQKPYGIYIKPDSGFLNLIEKLNQLIENKISLNIEFDFSIDTNQLNLIDFEKSIPELLRGLSLGYKLYKLVITNTGYITSNKYSSQDAYHIWYNLMLDKDLMCFTSEFKSGVIHKKLSNKIIKNILDKLDDKIIFDDELKEKIVEIYGSLDIYTQRNK